jgi:hypothetical protein
MIVQVLSSQLMLTIVLADLAISSDLSAQEFSWYSFRKSYGCFHQRGGKFNNCKTIGFI